LPLQPDRVDRPNASLSRDRRAKGHDNPRAPLPCSTVTQVDSERTYDDLPESDVATVLQVPLLWGQSGAITAPTPQRGAHRRTAGRHRRAEPSKHSGSADWLDHPMTHTARVGLVSAGLVLILFAGALLALALWFP